METGRQTTSCWEVGRGEVPNVEGKAPLSVMPCSWAMSTSSRLISAWQGGAHMRMCQLTCMGSGGSAPLKPPSVTELAVGTGEDWVLGMQASKGRVKVCAGHEHHEKGCLPAPPGPGGATHGHAAVTARPGPPDAEGLTMGSWAQQHSIRRCRRSGHLHAARGSNRTVRHACKAARTNASPSMKHHMSCPEVHMISMAVFL